MCFGRIIYFMALHNFSNTAYQLDKVPIYHNSKAFLIGAYHMTNAKQWTYVVYEVGGDVQFKYWALASYRNGVTTRYSREGQYAALDKAALCAHDLAKMLNAAGLTPKTEGATFGVNALPPGRFIASEEIENRVQAQKRAVQAMLNASAQLSASHRGAPSSPQKHQRKTPKP